MTRGAYTIALLATWNGDYIYYLLYLSGYEVLEILIRLGLITIRAINNQTQSRSSVKKCFFVPTEVPVKKLSTGALLFKLVFHLVFRIFFLNKIIYL